MADERHTTQIEVTANTSSAEAGIQRLLDKLNTAAERASGLGVGGGGRGTPSVGSSTTTSTAGIKAPQAAVPPGAATASTTSMASAHQARVRAAFDRGGLLEVVRSTPSASPGAATSSTAMVPYAPAPRGEIMGQNTDWQSTVNRARGAGLLSAMSVGGFGGGLSGAATAGQFGLMSLSGPAGPFSALGRGASMGAQYVAQQQAASGMKPSSLGKMSVGALAIGAALAAAGGAGVSARMRLAGERAALEMPEMQAMLASMPAHAGADAKFGNTRHDYMKFADEFAASPQKVASMMARTATGIGSPGLGYVATAHFTAQMLGAEMMGLSPDAFIGYGRTLAPGGGARSTLKPRGTLGRWGGLDPQTLRLLGFTQDMGLSGARANEAMQAITGIISGRAGAGLMTDDNALMGFGLGLKQTGIAQVQGLGATRAMARLMQAGTSAGQAFGANFAGLGQAALMGAAFQGASSPQEAMRNLNAMNDPEKIRDALVAMLGPEGAELALLGMGESGATAKGILRADRKSVSEGVFPRQETVDRALSVTKAGARKEARGQMLVDDQQSVRLIEFLDATQQHILNFAGPGGMADKIVKGITALAQSMGAKL